MDRAGLVLEPNLMISQATQSQHKEAVDQLSKAVVDTRDAGLGVGLLVLKPPTLCRRQGKTLSPASQSGFPMWFPYQIVPNRTPGLPQRRTWTAGTDFTVPSSMAPCDPCGHFAALIISLTH